MASVPAPVAAARPRASAVSRARVGVATITTGARNFIYKVRLRTGATSSSILTAQVCAVVTLALIVVRITDG